MENQVKTIKNKIGIASETILVAVCIALLEVISKNIFNSPLMSKKKWKTLYRRIQRLECEITE